MFFAAAVLAGHAGSPPAKAVTFAIAGVGSGTFGRASLIASPSGARAPAQGDERLCLSLSDGAPGNRAALLTWMRSNDAGGALATRPEATLTVPADFGGGLKQGTYRIDKITIADFHIKADPAMTKVWLEGANVNCEGLSTQS